MTKHVSGLQRQITFTEMTFELHSQSIQILMFCYQNIYNQWFKQGLQLKCVYTLFKLQNKVIRYA